MKLFFVIFFVSSCLLAGVMSFRGGHGRPLYGVIADANYVDSSLPLRGFEGERSRGGSRLFGSW
ncbi:hypothetical protein OESDEN_21517 [Oesophagostomum dentatum]|uniref:Uncharacterized protein n=1 Tax=Oesophagostomum dentatum TaxID=61180 RepID=A0A0B1S4P6_OESDE|nr:hypothetical protein OESDEN_21517 [Oesophagostomum dentatum]